MNAVTAIIIAAVSFSFYPLLNTIALETSSPYLLALLTQIMTAILSFGYLSYKIGSLSKTRDLFYLFFKLPIDTIFVPILSGTAVFAGAIFFLSALKMMSNAGATLIMETWPLMAMIIARALLTQKKWEPFKPLDFVLILITIVGMILITASEADVTLDSFLNNPFYFFTQQDLDGTLGIIMAILSAVCFAWAGVSRAYFAGILPEKMRIHFFKKTNSLSEANFTYMLTYLFGIPSAAISYYLFETNTVEMTAITMPLVVFLAISLIVTSMFYSYGLIVADNANVNMLWYFAPVLGVIWLVLFGYSTLTPLLVAGGFLIIIANVILILTSRKQL